MKIKSSINNILSQNQKSKLVCFFEMLWLASLEKAVKEQGLELMYRKLSTIVPDISSQYSSFFKIEGKYLLTKVRSEHAFQMFLVEKAIQMMNFNGSETIVDIGDSDGTHVQYLKGLLGDTYRTLSVDIDKKAVDKIKQKGLEAVNARAEELDQHNIDADLFMSFEMLEHLSSPIDFLHSLAEKTSCKGFVVTVPYLQQGRVALHYITESQKKDVYAGNTHIFELSPCDWRLIFQHAGWRIEYDQVYLQYPKKSWLKVTKPLWKKFDFEGFFGAILVRDDKWSNCYKDW